MKPPALDDLLQRLCHGDAAAAEQVFVTYEPYLRKVVRRQLPDRLRTRFDSTDIVQSVWRDLLDGFRKAGWRFASTAQLQAFLVKVTRNRFIDRCRQHSPALDREKWLTEVEPHDMPAAPGPDPSQEAEANDLWQRMLLLCPPEHRELLQLKRAGVPLPEIAARTGLHVGSVRRVLRTLAIRFAREQK
ncbi:MAG TPA: sigma-70 family RNA polymerase sigma factor [Gemmataceae bacterium]|jgi:RNA polymerase sigma-70 factor (ECF subfamily)|nr:sigma-70 family RNA polymerase sigma factor [Gemmataceae bacterium]